MKDDVRLDHGGDDASSIRSFQRSKSSLVLRDGDGDRLETSRDAEGGGVPADDDPSVTWTKTQKWLTISAGCLVCFVASLNATGILAAAEDIAHEFDIDIGRFDYTVFLITAWNAAAAIVPLFILPVMEDIGVLPLYYSAYFLFVAFVATQAVAPNFATLIVARVIAGSCGGILQDCVDGIAADIWGDDVDSRAISLSLYVFSLLGGLTMGPVIAGGILRYLDWRWILYVQLIIYGAILPYVVLTLKDPRKKSESASKASQKDRFLAGLNEMVLRAIRLLFTDFVVGTFTVLSAFAVSTVFMATQSIPLVFTALYGWPAWLTGVTQISIFIGEIFGLLLCLFQDIYIYPRHAHPGGNTKEEKVPEPRLYTAVPCCILGLAAGYFIYGWAADSNLHWILPNLGLFFIGVGIVPVVQAISIYVTDCYASNASSAISAVAFGENMLSAVLPLAATTMYNRLGFQWASSLLGFSALLLSTAPLVLIFAGPTLRAKNVYTG